MVVLARQRSYLGELFHRSVTAHLLEHCPVPILVLPVAAELPPAPQPMDFATATQYTTAVLTGLAPAA